MGIVLVFFFASQVVHIYFLYTPIFKDYFVLVVIYQLFMFSIEYKKMKTSKSSFIQGKKIKQLLEE